MRFYEYKHELERRDGEYYCKVCQWDWVKKPPGPCPGIPRYGYPTEQLKTFTQLRALKLKPADRDAPDGCYYIAQSPYRRYLYSIAEAKPRRQPTPRQIEAIQKMRAGLIARHTCKRCGYYDRSHGRGEYSRIRRHTGFCYPCNDLMIRRQKEAQIAQWAHGYYHGPADFLVLDSETTGLNESGTDEIIELAILNRSGNVLFSSLIQTQDPNREELATFIHGITREQLATAPTFPDVWPKIEQIIAACPNLLVYNSAFDYDLLRTTASRYGYTIPDASWECLMEMYAQYHGAYSNYWRSYTWQKLVTACEVLGVGTNDHHRAAADAHNSLEVLKALAALHGTIEILPPYTGPDPNAIAAEEDALGELEEHPF